MRDQLLIVDDEAGIRASLAAILQDEGYRTTAVSTAAEAREQLAKTAFDLVLLDLWLPDEDGMTLLGEVARGDGAPPVVVISGHANVDAAVRATRLGAYDFLEKPLALERVLVTVQNALDKVRMSRRLAQLAGELSRDEILVGSSLPIRRLQEELERAAASDSRILIFGENGTGKEVVARLVHRLSRRAARPFVEVNCAAIPEELIESELFGHVKGAFTGAGADRPGRFEQADGGTLFLDEIGDMSVKTQAKVLRALQEQRFERVGSTASVQVDVRVVAATNKDLEAEIRAGRFREDLYFRLAVIPLHVPPLRDRPGDVALLFEHFLAHFAREQGRRPKRIAVPALARLEEYPWPGNVRELRNFAERMMIMVPDDEIRVHDLPDSLRGDSTRGLHLVLDRESATLREARAAFEKRFIERKLVLYGGNVSRTAEVLDLERSHLYRKIRSYGIEVPRPRIR